MITEETKKITDTISVWGWHLLAWMFLIKSLGFLVTKFYVWFFGLVGVFIICEVIALNKKWKLESENGD